MKKLLLLLLLSLSFIGFSQNELPMQDGSWTECDFILTDSGGSTEPYESNENLTLTLCPPNDGGYVMLDFFEFSTQINVDVLSIYNGDSTNSPLIGTYSGVDGPGVIIADNTTGCLTLNFVSNESGTTTGWSTLVSCVSEFVINQPIDLFACDEFGNGFADFDLHENDQIILGNLDPNAYNVAYFLTLDDAEQNINPLVSPFANFTNPQLIYARVDELPTGNFEITSFNLFVDTVPFPTLQNVYEICDGGVAFVESGLGNQNLLFAWYLDGFILPNETNSFLLASQPGVYQLQVSTIDGCSNFTDFEVILTGVEDISPTSLVACDDDEDGFTVFNLLNVVDEILGGLQNPTVSLTFHETQADADANTNALDPIYTNTVPFGQTLFVRVDSIQGDCFGTTTLDLIVEIGCVSANPVEAFVCGDDPNIPVNYDLTENEGAIVDGQNPLDFSFEYYISQTNAEAQVNPITNPQSYEASGNSSVIFVRVESNQSGNSTIVEMYLNFILNPIVEFNGPYTICDGQSIVLIPTISDNQQYSYLWNTGETTPEIIVTEAGLYTLTVTDIWAGCTNSVEVEVIGGGNAPIAANPENLSSCVPNFIYDLTALIPDIIQTQNPADLVITFHNTLDFAITNTNPITNPAGYSPTNSIETIYVRVQNASDSCFSIAEFTITTDSSCPIVVNCGDNPINTSYCYEINDATPYVYVSTDGSPLQVDFIAGQVEDGWDELVVLDTDGVTNLNPEATFYGADGDLTGLSFTASGDTITVYIDSDQVISCATENYIPINYNVSCVDPNALPSCNSVLTTPSNGAVDVNETTNLEWTSASGIVNGYTLSVGITSGGTEVVDNEDIGNVLNYDLEVLDYEVTYYVTITPYNDNGAAENCQEFSFTTRSNPNQTVVCEEGMINTTYCFENNDTTEFNFQSSTGSTLTMVFNAGSTEVNFDEVSIIDSDGTILNPNMPYGNDGDFTGLSFTSSGTSITLRFDSDSSVSCANGSTCCTEQFDFDVFCSDSVGIIEVNAFVDDNGNSIFDANEFGFSNGYFTYEMNGDGTENVVNSSTGSFQIISFDENDTYDINFHLYEESAGCYDITVSMFDDISVATGNTVTVDFPVVEEQSCEDLAVYLINYWTPPRPGFSHENHIVLENLGFTNIASGTVEFTTDPLLVFNSASADNPNYTITNTATGFTVDFVNLLPGDVEYIDISLTCPASVDLGDIVTNTANYVTDSNDMVASNNYSTLSEVVVGSWDPNDKMESHGPRITYDEFVSSDEWLYYTIRFQNLGTAAAEFVRIEDALDNQLDQSTFQMLRSSHDYVVTRTENDLEWFFEDIDLPAEQDDVEGSQGYVYFRIKPQAGYVVGDIIPNTAAIYFDFNAPVITNRFDSEFVEDALSVSDFEVNGFELFPNPAKHSVTIQLNATNSEKSTISIYDVQGKLILEQHLANDIRTNIDVSDFQSGLYFVKLNSGTKELVKKLIIE